MKNDDLIMKYSHHFSVTECSQLSRDSTPYPMTARTKMGVSFDYIDGRYKAFNFKESRRSINIKIYSHRMIFYIRHRYLPECVDHSNHDTLDNSFENLRAATISQNRMNTRSHKGSTSKYLGVSWYKESGKWRSQTIANGKVEHIGLFTSETEAAQAYNTAAAKHHGEFANLNTIPDDE